MNQRKFLCIVLFVLSAACVFFAIERYQSNAKVVRAMNQRGGRMFDLMTGGEKINPQTPLATKQALIGALVFGAAGAFCFMTAKPKKISETG